MKSGEAFRLLLMLAFGLLAGSQLAKYYMPRNAVVQATSTPAHKPAGDASASQTKTKV